jgi:hypothetical protein
MISRILFESPRLLLAILVVVQFGLICLWSWRRSRVWARVVWAGFAMIPVLLIISIAVVTPREQIIGLCRMLATRVEGGDVAGIGERLADGFEAADLGKSEFLVRVEESLTRYRVDDARLRAFEVESGGRDEATAVFDATCTVRSADSFRGRLPSRWRVTLRRPDRLWLVTKVEALPTPLSPVRDLRDWLH